MNLRFTSEQLQQFHDDGYLVVRGMADVTLRAEMLEVTHAHLHGTVPPLEYEAEVGYPGAPASLDAPGGRTARRLRDAFQRHDCFRRWAEDARLAGMLEQLFHEPVCLTLAHHNCVMTKHPQFGTATGWHRDIRYWRFMRPDLVAVWLALGEERPANGGLRVIPGSHRLQIAREQLDELDFLRPDAPQNQSLFAQGIDVHLQPGDVLFFHSGLFHAASRNESAEVKTSVVFAYRGASNLPLPGSRSAKAGSVALKITG